MQSYPFLTNKNQEKGVIHKKMQSICKVTDFQAYADSATSTGPKNHKKSILVEFHAYTNHTFQENGQKPHFRLFFAQFMLIMHTSLIMHDLLP